MIFNLSQLGRANFPPLLYVIHSCELFTRPFRHNLSRPSASCSRSVELAFIFALLDELHFRDIINLCALLLLPPLLHFLLKGLNGGAIQFLIEAERPLDH